ncbi:MAG: hypothetical protein RL091_769 [Verrucomicrobiota bacterium]|jgi:hypothetical protein
MSVAPYNTDTPFTADDVARFNRFTHFPKDLQKENVSFAADSARERAQAETTLKGYGKSEMPDDVSRALERLRKARYQIFTATIRSRELAPPWSVVGPARYSEHARPERAHRVMGRAFDEYNAAKATLAHRLQRHGPPLTIRSDDATALAQLEAKIAAAQKAQERMKATNRIIRDANTDEAWKIGRLETECGIKEAHARQLLKPDFAGRTGFAGFELTNNAANIRRMEDRVKALVAESHRESVTFQFSGGRVEDHAADCRVRIYHDEKPAAEVITKLKGHGFHWTPSLGCWQRLRNNAARHAATVVTGVNWPKAEAPEIVADDGVEPARLKSTVTAPAPRAGIAP